VLVPFGRKSLTGYIIRVSSEPPAGEFRLRPLRDVLDSTPVISASLIETALWVSDHYFAPPGEVLRAVLPAGTETTEVTMLKLTDRAARLLGGGLRPPGLRRQEEEVLETLARQGELTLQQLQAGAGARNLDESIQSLVQGGWIECNVQREKPRVRSKEESGLRALTASAETLARLTPAQSKLYAQLTPGAAPVALRELLRTTGASAAAARSLVKLGLAETLSIRVERIPEDLKGPGSGKHVSLTAEQTSALEKVRDLLERRSPKRCLLHGVTGSGKTEVYLRAIAEVLAGGGSAILLVPEIGLTPMLSRIALFHFPGKVALLHSGMSAGERLDQWQRIRDGGASLVVGTRSAVFAPLDNPRLIVIDEEHDGSYKQSESPAYHAREVAWRRVEQSGGVLLLGSATPAVETYYAATVSRQCEYAGLPGRVQARALPHVELVDMGEEFRKQGKRVVVSGLLAHELSERLGRGEQSIVLLNRRGYARTLLCRGCGHIFICADCSIPMTYHQGEGRLACHYCGVEREPPSVCSECGGKYIYYLGVGTEQLEELIRSVLPAARVARIDRDTARKQGYFRKTLLDFEQRRLDVLVGTQMLAKGHDFPNVTLVGVVSADAGLAFPDFRSAERVFQLLTQVAGRAGRGASPGTVIIQSFHTDHYAVRFACRQDYEGFFKHETEFRKYLSYPPYSRLVQVLVADADQAKGRARSESIAQALKLATGKFVAQQKLRVLGPAVAPLEKLRGEYRFQLLLKSFEDAPTIEVLRDAFAYLEARKVSLKKVHVDVDPLSLL
jgi:primosomal protein N' (replication factor Y)